MSWLVWWIAAGQSLGAIPDFARGTVEIIAGYGPAMSLADPTIRWGYWAALGIAVAVGFGVRSATRSARDVSSAGLAVVSAFIVFATFKQGFVRNDIGHATLFFGGMIVLVAVLPWGRDRRLEAGLALALAACAFFGITRIDPAAVVNPVQAPKDLAKTVRLTFRSAERDEMVAAGRAQMEATYAVTPATLRALAGRTVHVVPWEIGAAWAYRLRWNPLPVFQDYSAYTAYLDEQNADRLAAPGGPERVLQQEPRTIDSRLPAWDPPRQNVELLCRYRPVTVQKGWRVLQRGADRCGAERTLSTVTARWGQPVSVPRTPAGTMLTVCGDRPEAERARGAAVAGLEARRALRAARRDPGPAGDRRHRRRRPAARRAGGARPARAVPDVACAAEHHLPAGLADRVAVRR